ncbi:hypothetical protein L202_07042 [Cryptococcus amylolentus CBS 6039]|uniref:Uncharacterized protein n=1 Tax=Cryptococcus amylolentus CBS 6039 TaxID=1295533 RepID=A0A1E3HH18_9TREE|nr:hypothetical protein L202_07042 [Cryptococcus amylolentus CBS 6039]ODN74711.1 hypothetical protein L202_07042 [Cryptococcus amylolentus CBS 6039]
MTPSPAPSSPLSSAPPSPCAPAKARVSSGAKWATSPPTSQGIVAGGEKGKASTSLGNGAVEVENDIDELDPSDEEKENTRRELETSTSKKRKRGRPAKGENKGVKKLRVSRAKKEEEPPEIGTTSTKIEEASVIKRAPTLTSPTSPSKEGEEEAKPLEVAQDPSGGFQPFQEVRGTATSVPPPSSVPKSPIKTEVEPSVSGEYTVPTEPESTGPPLLDSTTATVSEVASASANASGSSSTSALVLETTSSSLSISKPKYVRPLAAPIDIPPGVRPPPRKNPGRPSKKYLEEHRMWLEEVEEARARLRGEGVEGGAQMSKDQKEGLEGDADRVQDLGKSTEDTIPILIGEQQSVVNGVENPPAEEEPKLEKESSNAEEEEKELDKEEASEALSEEKALSHTVDVESPTKRRKMRHKEIPQQSSPVPTSAPAETPSSPRDYAPPPPPDLPAGIPPPPKKLNPGRPTNKYLEEYASWWELVEKEKERLGEGEKQTSEEDKDMAEKGTSLEEAPVLDSQASAGQTSARGRGRGRGRGKASLVVRTSRPTEISQPDPSGAAAAVAIATPPSTSTSRPSEFVIGEPPSSGHSESWTPRGRLKVRGRAKGTVRTGRVSEGGRTPTHNGALSSPLQNGHGSPARDGSPGADNQGELLKNGSSHVSEFNKSATSMRLNSEPNEVSSQCHPSPQRQSPEPQTHINLPSPTPNPPKQTDIMILPVRPNPPLPKEGHLASFLVLNPFHFLTPSDERQLPIPPVPAGGFSFREKKGKTIQRFLAPRKVVLDITTPGTRIGTIPSAEEYYKSSLEYRGDRKGKARAPSNWTENEGQRNGGGESEADEAERLDQNGRKVQMLYRVLVVNKNEEEEAMERDEGYAEEE